MFFYQKMQVQNISHQNFTSRINPVPSFTINTKAGKLHFEEPTLEQINKRGFVKRLTLFFAKILQLQVIVLYGRHLQEKK